MFLAFIYEQGSIKALGICKRVGKGNGSVASVRVWGSKHHI